MSFLNVLQMRGLDYVVSDIQFRPVVPLNGGKFAALIKKIVNENLSVYIDYDCDPDGYFAAKCLTDTFSLVGHKNVVLCKHTIKRHELHLAYANTIANQHYDVVFILDSSTNNIAVMEAITSSGAICCVVDHHESDYVFADYPDNAIVINPNIDAKLKSSTYYDCLSAGAIMALLCTYTLQTSFNIQPPQDLYLYGVITLYSDCMDLSNKYNISYISRFQNTQRIDSALIRLFFDERYDHFDKSYISFKLVPRLNSLFRTENFELLYRLFFETDTVDLEAVKQQIESHYSECKKYTQRLLDSCEVTQYKDFVMAVLDQSAGTFARNFTGLVANSLASDYNKPVICLHQSTPLEWAGSVRDPFSRNLLSIMRTLCYAQGHKSAFGIKMPSQEAKMLAAVLSGELPSITEADESVIMLDWDKQSVDFKQDLQLMALFNEFGGLGLPMAMGALTIKDKYKIFRDEKKISIYGDGEKFICFSKVVDFGDTMLIKPTLRGSSYTNIVDNIHICK